jgi:hypothetical protein
LSDLSAEVIETRVALCSHYLRIWNDLKGSGSST